MNIPRKAPEEVYSFICQCYRGDKSLAIELNRRGLDWLTADHLKFVSKQLKVNGILRGAISSLRKNELMDKIQSAFYEDFPACQRVNRAAIQKLAQRGIPKNRNTVYTSASSRMSSLSATVPVSAPTAVAMAPVPLMNQQGYEYAVPVAQRSGVSKQSSKPGALPQKIHRPSKFTVHPQGSLHTTVRDIANNKPTSSTTSNAVQVSLPGTHQRANPTSDHSSSTAIPRTVQRPLSTFASTTNSTLSESALVMQVMGMGFPDRNEIQTCIRRLRQKENNGSSLTADAVMLDIIQHREEAAEARQMDQARLLSEQSRKEEAARLRAQIEQELQVRMAEASWDTWLRDTQMFPHSWLLRMVQIRNKMESKMQGSLKISFIKLLDLEKKSHKWFQQNMPKAYFETVLTPKLVESWDNTNKLERVILEEIDTLRHGMFTLSEQREGVPRLFIEAYDRAAKEDDEIVMVGYAEAKENTGEESNSTTSSCPPSPQKLVSSQEVIEIL